MFIFWCFWQDSKDETQFNQRPKPSWQDDVVLASSRTYSTHLIPLQICWGTLGNVWNIWHTEEWAQRRYPVRCALHTTSRGHRQLWWGDHCLECGVWTHTVSLPDPSVSTKQQCSWYAIISVHFQWIMTTVLLILSQILYIILYFKNVKCTCSKLWFLQRIHWNRWGEN